MPASGDGGPLRLVAPNITEFNLRDDGLQLTEDERFRIIRAGKRFADVSPLWEPGRQVVVMPPGYDRRWFADLHEAVGAPLPAVVEPSEGSGLVIADLLADGRALDLLVDHLRSAGEVQLASWGATPELYGLLDVLEARGVAVELDAPPPAAAWTSDYLDSKLSGPDLAARLAHFRVPETLTVSSWAEVDGAVRALAGAGGAVLKAPLGVGGNGIAMFPPATGNGDGAGVRSADVDDDPYLRSFPLQVQRRLQPAPVWGCPAIDLHVGPAGATTMFESVMQFDGHLWRSTLIGDGLMPPGVAAAIRTTAAEAAQEAARLGFRGWLGLDYIATGDEAVFVTEINARRTGAAHGYGLLRQLGREDGVVSVDDRLPVPGPGPLGYDAVQPVFHRLWDDGVLAFPTSVRGLARDDPTMSVAVVGSSSAEVDASTAALARAVDTHLAHQGARL